MLLTFEGTKIWEIEANHSLMLDDVIKMACIETNEEELAHECFELVHAEDYQQPDDHLETILFLKAQGVHTYIIDSYNI